MKIIRDHNLIVDCEVCNGDGCTVETITRTIEGCCGGSNWECGARGCTGPIPEQVLDQEQVPCEYCIADGKISYPLTPEQEQELEGLLKVGKPLDYDWWIRVYNTHKRREKMKKDFPEFSAYLEYNQAQSRINEILTELTK